MRKIIHCDCDCFFAAVEMRDDPLLCDRPIAVGGKAGRRGVIATCNYPARAYGVRSAMATAVAQRLCPDLLVLPGRMEKYREAAQQIRDIFYDYTDLVEPLSLDEAYLDVSESDRCQGSATRMAAEIRQRVKTDVGITISAGVASNKFLAKVGSDWNKPDGLCVITPGQVDDFVKQLPVSRLNGVGRVTAEKLQRMSISTCGDLQQYSDVELTQAFGGFGLRLYELSRGEDSREVKTSRRRKSLSVEHTFVNDLISLESCLQQLPDLFVKFQQRLQPMSGQYRVSKQWVKIKFANFQATTMECLASGTPRLAVFQRLLCDAYQRQTLPVRLLGVGVRFADEQQGGSLQLPLFPEVNRSYSQA
jgi:DNA polymerase-4